MTYLLLVLLIVAVWPRVANGSERLVVLTVATERTDGFLRTKRSLEQFGHDYEVLGLDTPWNGGDVKRTLGGGQKVRLLREALEKYQHDDQTVILFIDGYDVIVNGDAPVILNRFRQNGAKVLFSAEPFCWPNKALATDYPVVKSGKRYLNSGAFIGYAPYLAKLLAEGNVQDDDDDQLFYTLLFLDKNLREKYEIALDSVSTIFQNLNGADEDVELDLSPQSPGSASRRAVRLVNLAYNTEPLVVHGNGPSKIHLNRLANYLGNWWNADGGCVACAEDQISLDEKPERMPFVVLTAIIGRPVPFVELFLDSLLALSYPGSRMGLYIHNGVENYTSEVADFRAKAAKHFSFAEVLSVTTGDARFSYVKATPSSGNDERAARGLAAELCLQKDCDYLFMVDADARLDTVDCLQRLIQRNKPMVAPLLAVTDGLWSNFWGALSEDGYYARSDDYLAILNGERRGLWNVPYISSAYLVRKDRLAKLTDAYDYNSLVDADMSLCHYCRDNGYFMYVDNTVYFGHVVSLEGYDFGRPYPDLYSLFANTKEWEAKYLHENYSKVLNEDYVVGLACPDVYEFPLFSAAFCKELIGTMEAFNKWSSGTHKDERLQGGYENVPTRDIHMNQVGLEQVWLKILDSYVRPVQEKTFIGYYSHPPRALMNFVVRYKPDEQPSLRPHHDASTYTIDVALNQADVDYEGGGVRYIRYNCSVTKLQPGWAIIHPGRLTHMHEGLQTTSGVRYIMVSFVDP